MWKSILTLGTTLFLVGCSTISTHNLSDRSVYQEAREGISYHLPTGNFSLQLAENNGAIFATIGGAVMVPDPSRQYITQIDPAILANNKVKIDVGSANNLLATAKSESTGQLAELLQNAVKSVVGLQSSELPSTGDPFYNNTYPFDQFQTASADANAFVVRRFNTKCVHLLNPRTLAEAEKRKCGNLDPLARLASENKLIDIQVQPLEEGASLREIASGGQDLRPACPRDALCYHPLAPVSVSIYVAGVAGKRDIILIPDKRKLAFVRLRSGLFAKQDYDLTFSDGVLTSYGHDSQSEFVGLVGLPFKLVSSILTETAGLLTARTTVQTNESAYQAAVIANIEQQLKTLQVCDANPGVCPSSAQRLLQVNSPTIEPEDVVDGADPNPLNNGGGIGSPGNPNQ